MSRLFFIACALLMLPSLAQAQLLRSVPQEVYRPAQPLEQTTVAAPQAAPQPRRAVPEALRLPPLSDDERRALEQSDGRRAMRIGINRNPADYRPVLPGDAELSWSPSPGGGLTGTLVLSSEGAGALRSHLQFQRLPSASRVLFQGSSDIDASGKSVDAADIGQRGNNFWSPTTLGETQTIRVELPAAAAKQELSFSVTSLSHIADAGFLRPRDLGDVGDSLHCHLDLNCFSSPVIRQMADSVVKMVFTDFGATFLCTGNLVADGDTGTFIPYFYTAAHCIGSQGEASSLETYWFFESTACDSLRTAPFSTRSGGAQLLYADFTGDVSLLRLNQQPPAGAVFAGWKASPIDVNEEIISPHHPSGDLKKIALGTFVGHGEPNQPTGTLFNRVNWDLGITESGSSGAGLFTVENDSFYLRGGLWGGSSNCFNLDGPDLYSRFELAYPDLSGYLAHSGGAITPESGWWWNPRESGRGFTIEVRDGKLFIAGFLYAADGRATWVSSGGPMSSATSYSGQLTAFANGQTLTGSYRPPVSTGPLGKLTISFTAPDRATLTWPGGTMSIERYVFGEGPRSAGVEPEVGWWWNPAESGRGFAIETQGDILFITGYMYDISGNPIWFTANGELDVFNRFTYTWIQFGNGQTLTGAYQSPVVVDSDVGAISVQFNSDTSASLTLPDGRIISLSRFVF